MDMMGEYTFFLKILRARYISDSYKPVNKSILLLFNCKLIRNAHMAKSKVLFSYDLHQVTFALLIKLLSSVFDWKYKLYQICWRLGPCPSWIKYKLVFLESWNWNFLWRMIKKMLCNSKHLTPYILQKFIFIFFSFFVYFSSTFIIFTYLLQSMQVFIYMHCSISVLFVYKETDLLMQIACFWILNVI